MYCSTRTIYLVLVAQVQRSAGNQVFTYTINLCPGILFAHILIFFLYIIYVSLSNGQNIDVSKIKDFIEYILYNLFNFSIYYQKFR